MESASAASSTPTPMIDTACFARGRLSARTPFATNPASGSAGTSHRSCRAPGISALEEIDVLQVDRPLVAVDREDDRQAHPPPRRGPPPHQKKQKLGPPPPTLR